MEFNLKIFYTIGMVPFFAAALFQIWTLYTNWSLLLISQNATSIINILVSLLFAFVFYHFAKEIKPESELTDKNIQEKIREIQRGKKCASNNEEIYKRRRIENGNKTE